jgi:hypothetical protein
MENRLNFIMLLPCTHSIFMLQIINAHRDKFKNPRDVLSNVAIRKAFALYDKRKYVSYVWRMYCMYCMYDACTVCIVCIVCIVCMTHVLYVSLCVYLFSLRIVYSGLSLCVCFRQLFFYLLSRVFRQTVYYFKLHNNSNFIFSTDYLSTGLGI